MAGRGTQGPVVPPADVTRLALLPADVLRLIALYLREETDRSILCKVEPKVEARVCGSQDFAKLLFEKEFTTKTESLNALSLLPGALRPDYAVASRTIHNMVNNMEDGKFNLSGIAGIIDLGLDQLLFAQSPYTLPVMSIKFAITFDNPQVLKYLLALNTHPDDKVKLLRDRMVQYVNNNSREIEMVSQEILDIISSPPFVLDSRVLAKNREHLRTTPTVPHKTSIITHVDLIGRSLSYRLVFMSSLISPVWLISRLTREYLIDTVTRITSVKGGKNYDKWAVINTLTMIQCGLHLLSCDDVVDLLYSTMNIVVSGFNNVNWHIAILTALVNLDQPRAVVSCIIQRFIQRIPTNIIPASTWARIEFVYIMYLYYYHCLPDTVPRKFTASTMYLPDRPPPPKGRKDTMLPAVDMIVRASTVKYFPSLDKEWLRSGGSEMGDIFLLTGMRDIEWIKRHRGLKNAWF